MARQRLLIVGNGMASVRFVEHLCARAPDTFDITIVGAERAPGYNRVLLSAFLANDVAKDALVFHDADWYQSKNIHLITGCPVASIDANAKIAVLADNRSIAFDLCVFATGSRAARLPIPGANLPGVISFRDLDDCAALETAALAGQHAAVIGGGLLGIEAAYGLARRGAKVTLVHVMNRLMERQLDARAALLVKRALERKGVRVLLETQTKEIAGDTQARALCFADGSRLNADLVVMAVGIAANCDIAAKAGLGVNRGILVDDQMAGTMPGFYAVGECAEHRSQVHGLVEPAYAQAQCLAAHLCGDADASFTGFTASTNLKVSGISVFSSGDFLGGPGCEFITFEDRASRIYRRLVVRSDRLAGVVLVGDIDDGLWYRALIAEAAPLGDLRKTLIFGADYTSGGHADAA